MSHIDQITARLRELAVELGDPELEEDRAGQLAREAGELVAEAQTEIDRRIAEAASTAVEDDAGDEEPTTGDG